AAGHREAHVVTPDREIADRQADARHRGRRHRLPQRDPGELIGEPDRVAARIRGGRERRALGRLDRERHRALAAASSDEEQGCDGARACHEGDSILAWRGLSCAAAATYNTAPRWSPPPPGPRPTCPRSSAATSCSGGSRAAA